MGNGSFKQSTIAEGIAKDTLEEIEIRRRRVRVSQDTSDYNKRRKLV